MVFDPKAYTGEDVAALPMIELSSPWNMTKKTIIIATLMNHLKASLKLIINTFS